MGEQSDASVRSQVDLAGEGGDLDVDPVIVEWREFVACMGDGLRVPVLT